MPPPDNRAQTFHTLIGKSLCFTSVIAISVSRGQVYILGKVRTQRLNQHHRPPVALLPPAGANDADTKYFAIGLLDMSVLDVCRFPLHIDWLKPADMVAVPGSPGLPRWRLNRYGEDADRLYVVDSKRHLLYRITVIYYQNNWARTEVSKHMTAAGPCGLFAVDGRRIMITCRESCLLEFFEESDNGEMCCVMHVLLYGMCRPIRSVILPSVWHVAHRMRLFIDQSRPSTPLTVMLNSSLESPLFAVAEAPDLEDHQKPRLFIVAGNGKPLYEIQAPYITAERLLAVERKTANLYAYINDTLYLVDSVLNPHMYTTKNVNLPGAPLTPSAIAFDETNRLLIIGNKQGVVSIYLTREWLQNDPTPITVARRCVYGGNGNAPEERGPGENGNGEIRAGRDNHGNGNVAIGNERHAPASANNPKVVVMCGHEIGGGRAAAGSSDRHDVEGRRPTADQLIANPGEKAGNCHEVVVDHSQPGSSSSCCGYQSAAALPPPGIQCVRMPAVKDQIFGEPVALETPGQHSSNQSVGNHQLQQQEVCPRVNDDGGAMLRNVNGSEADKPDMKDSAGGVGERSTAGEKSGDRLADSSDDQSAGVATALSSG